MESKFYTKPTTTLQTQKEYILATYANVESCDIRNGELVCIMDITPSTVSDTYRIKISYKMRDFPRAWVLSPELKKYGDESKHLYPSVGPYPELCTFYPKYREWRSEYLLSQFFIPWISTWLNTYEYWLITGEWHYDESPHGQPRLEKFKE
jgi:hypothetical protein